MTYLFTYHLETLLEQPCFEQLPEYRNKGGTMN
jgi:hypothetical protein